MNTSQPVLNILSDVPSVLHTVHPDTQISQNAAEQLNACINYVAGTILNQAKLVSSYDMTSKGLTPSSRLCDARAIQAGVRITLPSELGKYAVSEGTKSVTIMYANGPEDALRRLKLNIDSVSEFLLNTCKKIDRGTAMYFTAALEYLMAEILELAGNSARDRSSDMIDIRDLKLATENDEELSAMLAKWNWMGGGVLPNIHRSLLPDVYDDTDEHEDLTVPPSEPVLTQEYIQSRATPPRKKSKRVSRKKSKRVSRKKSKRRGR